MSTEPLALRIAIDDQAPVSALLLGPATPRAALVLAHGAGAGMRHAFMEQVAAALAAHDVATLRFQFPFIESGLRRPDPAPVAQRAVRAAVGEAARRLHGVPLFAGGKSFGGRMTSQAQAEAPLPDVRGLVIFGFPLHPAGKPSVQRADHLDRVRCPMLFQQGTRDALADLALISSVTKKLEDRATLRIVDDGDHAFHVRAKSGSNDAQVIEDLARSTAEWMKGLLRG